MSVSVKWIKQFLQTTETKSLLYAAAGLSIFAALVHGIVTPEHFEEWWGYGTFFMTAALVQLFYGLLLIFQPWQPDPIRETKGFPAAYLYWAGIIGNGFLIVCTLSHERSEYRSLVQKLEKSNQSVLSA